MSFAHAELNDKTEREHVRNSFGLLPQGYCERKTLNLETMTSSVLSVLLLIYESNEHDTRQLYSKPQYPIFSSIQNNSLSQCL